MRTDRNTTIVIFTSSGKSDKSSKIIHAVLGLLYVAHAHNQLNLSTVMSTTSYSGVNIASMTKDIIIGLYLVLFIFTLKPNSIMLAGSELVRAEIWPII